MGKFPHARPSALRRPLDDEDASPTPDHHGDFLHLDNLRRSFPLRNHYLQAKPPGLTPLCYRALVTPRVSRQADEGSQLHERLVELTNLAFRQQRLSHLPEPAAHRPLTGIAALAEQATEHALTIGFKNRQSLV